MDKKKWDVLASHYFEELTSPFEDEQILTPLHRIIEKIENKEKLVAADLGTGIGNFIPKLSENFRKVVAIDFSRKMLEIAKRRNKSYTNVGYIERDMCNLQINEEFDVIFAINSILPPSVKEVNKILSEVYASIKQGGLFVGVFPSINAVLYQAMLSYEKELELVDDEGIAQRRAARKIGRKDYDFMFGFLNSDGRQKHYYQFELKYRLRKVGFKNIRIGKIHYPWHICIEPRFETEQEMWDWLVVAKK